MLYSSILPSTWSWYKVSVMYKIETLCTLEDVTSILKHVIWLRTKVSQTWDDTISIILFRQKNKTNTRWEKVIFSQIGISYTSQPKMVGISWDQVYWCKYSASFERESVCVWLRSCTLFFCFSHKVSNGDQEKERDREKKRG